MVGFLFHFVAQRDRVFLVNDNELMSREEVAELLRIKPNSVRDTLRRYGITEHRGYPRAEVEALQRPGQGARTDLVKEPAAKQPPSRKVAAIREAFRAQREAESEAPTAPTRPGGS